MKVLYLIDYQPTVLITRSFIGLDVPDEMINWSWQLIEAHGLSKYADVVLVSLGQRVPRGRFDVVYCSCESQSVYGYKIAKELGLPLVVQVIGRIPEDEFADKFWKKTKEVLVKADALIGVSPLVFRSLVEIHDNVFMNYHGVYEEIADKVPESNKRENYVTVAKLMKHKRVDLIMEVFARMWKEEDLIVIGDGPEADNLVILNEIWCKPAIFVGALDDRQKFYYLKRCKALISASKSEQFFIPLAESLYCRTPAIIYELDNIKEIYHDGYGSIFYFKTKEELMRIIEKLDRMSDEKIIKIGEKGRKYVIDNGLTLSERSRRLKEILEKVIT